MKLKSHVRAIRASGVYSRSQEYLVVQLFESLGSACEVTVSSAGKWISEKRKARISNYFPNDVVNKDGFIQFFRSRTKNG